MAKWIALLLAACLAWPALANEAAPAVADPAQSDAILRQAHAAVVKRLTREREAAIRSVWNGFDSGDLDAFTHFGTRLAQRLTHYAESVKEGT